MPPQVSPPPLARVFPLTEEDAAGAGGPVRLHEAAAAALAAGVGAGRAGQGCVGPPRPAPAPGDQRVLRQRSL